MANLGIFGEVFFCGGNHLQRIYVVLNIIHHLGGGNAVFALLLTLV